MKRTSGLLATLVLLLATQALPVRAQYLYLDANGDGQNDEADRMSAGPTTLDLWIRTDQNRDGSPVICTADMDSPVSINAYVVNLSVVNGTVSWDSYANLMTWQTALASAQSPTALQKYYAGAIFLEPGAYKFATLTVSPTDGNPSIQISATTLFPGGLPTALGSTCPGADFDNTLKLGLDWFDADGVGPASETTTLDARIYAVNSNSKVKLRSGRPFNVLQIEPIGSGFAVTDVNVASVVMKSVGTGTVDQISATPGRAKSIGDHDGNEVMDLSVAFAKADLRQLFANVSGNQDITVSIEGNLTTAGTFRGTIVLRVEGGGGPSAARVFPNPLNPGAVLEFATTKAGSVRVTLYDLSGRLVRVLRDEVSEAGYHQLRIDGRSANGEKLASGVYVYRIATPEGASGGKVTILK
ncbi:MAG TPA: T9SS type A sorting domain-containing protein [Candidatus Eisenbacteria bacterium]|nr:T9SS type A sorting domain-containing protein [Candidatus Eisenbacteria bacterium]